MNAALGDDPTIGDDEDLLRRIPAAFVVPDDLKGKRLSSQGFLQDGADGLVSVYIASEVESPKAVMAGCSEPFLVSLKVRVLRELRLGIARDKSSGGPGHAVIIGHKTKSMLNRMAREAVWVKPYVP